MRSKHFSTSYEKKSEKREKNDEKKNKEKKIDV